MLLSAFATGCASPARAPASPLPVVAGERRSQAGVSFVDVAVGTGTPVSPRRCVFADYTGWLEDGTRFDTSLEAMPGGPPAAPVSFVQGTGKVMRGWEIGFDGMRVGGRRRLFIPYTLGYGSAGNPPVIPPRTALVFDVEVHAVTDATRPGECPPWSSVRP